MVKVYIRGIDTIDLPYDMSAYGYAEMSSSRSARRDVGAHQRSAPPRVPSVLCPGESHAGRRSVWQVRRGAVRAVLRGRHGPPESGAGAGAAGCSSSARRATVAPISHTWRMTVSCMVEARVCARPENHLGAKCQAQNQLCLRRVFAGRRHATRRKLRISKGFQSP